MSLHTRLIGALDGVILSLTAVLMVVLLFALLDPSYDRGRSTELLAERQSSVPQVIVTQIDTENTRRL